MTRNKDKISIYTVEITSATSFWVWPHTVKIQQTESSDNSVSFAFFSLW